MKKIFIALMATIGLATCAWAQTAYDMNVKLKNGSVFTYAADDVDEVTFTEQEVVEDEFNILTSTYIPDAGLRNYIKDHIAEGASVYTNLQAKRYRGMISINAAQAVSNFKGIEYFVNLDSLKIVSNTTATSLDISALKNLSFLQLLYCTKITEVKIGNINSLKHLDWTGSNKLNNLNISSDNSATINLVEVGSVDMSNRKNLEYLDVGGISTIGGVNVVGCENLKYINTYSTSIEDIDFTGCNKLEQIYIHDNKKITSVDVSHLKNTLTVLNLRATNIPGLDVSGFSKLETLYLQNCKLCRNVNVTGCESLRIFRTDGSLISSIDLRDCHKLYEVHVYDDPFLEEFLIGDCPDLVYLNIFNVPIQSLYLGEMPMLKQLWAYNNSNMVKIDISKVKQAGPYSYYLDYNEKLSEIKVWSTFDVNNPPEGIYKDDTATYVYEFSE